MTSFSYWILKEQFPVTKSMHHPTLLGQCKFSYFFRNCWWFSFLSSWLPFCNQRSGKEKHLCCAVQRSLVVQRLSSLQPERCLSSWGTLILRWWSQLASLERILLLCQESWDENQTSSLLELSVPERWKINSICKGNTVTRWIKVADNTFGQSISHVQRTFLLQAWLSTP